MRLDEQPLRAQLLTWLLVPLMLVLAADAVITVRDARAFAERAYDRALLEMARDVALHLRVSDGRVVLDLPQAARSILFEDPQDRVFFEVLEGGRRLDGEAIEPAPRTRASDPKPREFVYDGAVGDQPARIAELRVDDGFAPGLPAMMVRVAETRNKRDTLAHEISAETLIPQVLMILLAALVVWVGVYRGLRPLESLQRALAQRSHLDCSPLPEGGMPLELRSLVRSINALLQRLEHVLALQSRFIADAAHQLKTPVAGIMAQTELLLRETDLASCREIGSRLYVGTERLSRLVAQLLALARSEPDAATLETLEPIDLNPFALEIATRWVPHARERSIDLGFEGSEGPAMVKGDASRLADLLDNLVDNAIRYSQEGGRVTVRVWNATRPTLSVSDDAERIADSELPRLFERFRRRAGSGQPGSGLGLAIVREVARLHGAEITLQPDADGTGNVFNIAFPPWPAKADL
jgi:two-component system sensor histidine kinase TctE